jgi:hypothetical protein
MGDGTRQTAIGALPVDGRLRVPGIPAPRSLPHSGDGRAVSARRLEPRGGSPGATRRKTEEAA